MRDMTVNADALTGLELEFHLCKALGALDQEAPNATLADFVEAGGVGPFTWETLGPLIDQHHITIFHDAFWLAGMNAEVGESDGVGVLNMKFEAEGSTALEAVMRCLVKRGPDPRPAWEPT